MTGEIGAAGDLVTGGLIANAVERPGAGHGGPGGACLNCGTELVGEFCYNCGQPAHIHRTLTALWHDLAHGVLHFEGKIWRTLPMLVFKPGTLTRRYIHGERARFVSPMALFLFSVFLMFAVIQAIGVHLETPHLDAAEQREAQAEIDKELVKLKAARVTLDKQRADAVAAGKPTKDIDLLIKANKEELTANRSGAAFVGIGQTASGGRFTDMKTGWPALDAGIEKANANPNLTLYKVQSSAYKFSWALIPISVPFVWLMFAWRLRYKVYDHAIFVIYSLSFATLLAVALTICFKLNVAAGLLWSIFVFGMPAHMYVQLRGAYQLGWFKALLRTIALATFSLIAATIFILLLLALGILG
jgi:hypothetical protein